MLTESYNLSDELLSDKKKGLIGLVKDPSDIPEKTVEPKIRVVNWDELLILKFPPRENILTPCLPTQGLCMIHAPRGVGKTFVALNIAIAVASGSSFLKWTAEKPRGVLYLDGEMPAVTIQERLNRIIISTDNKPIATFKVITPDLQASGMPNLAQVEGQEAIEPYLKDVAMVVVDNISTLCQAGRENEGESWLPVQEWALKQRSKGLSVLFIHHAGKGGTQRGTSRREDVLDTVINLKRPADYRQEEGARFEVHFEKARGIHGDDVKPFEAQLISSPDGKHSWVVKDLEESLTAKVANMLNDGVPQGEIAELLKVSKGTVSKHKQKAQAAGLITGK